MKFSLKIFIIILEIAIIPLLVVGYIAYFNIKQETTRNLLSKLDVIAQIQKNRLQSNIDDAKDLLNLFLSKSQLRLLLNNFNNNPLEETRKEMIDNILDAKAGSITIKKILLANPKGIIVASTDASFMGKDISNEDIFLTGIKQEDVSFIKKDSGTGEVDQYFVGPMKFNDKIIGVGIIIANTNNIISLVDDYSGLESTGEIILVKDDGNGNAIFLTPVRFDKDAALNRVILKEKINTVAISAINKIEDVFSGVTNYRDKPVLAATRYVDSVGWGIVVEMDQSEALLPLKRLQNLFFFILFTVICLIVIIVIPTSISVTRPIKKLILLSQKITEGDLTQNLQIKSKDEIGELSYFLNQMVDSLKKITEKFKNLNLNLEKEVKLKTARLEEHNVFLSEANSAMVNLSEDLEEEKNKFAVAKTNMEAVITGIGDALIATDNKGVITIVNPAAEKMFGFKMNEVVGKSIFDTILLEDEKGETILNEKRPIFASFYNKKIVNAVYYCVCKNKTKITVAINSAPVLLNNNIIGAVDIFRDITKEKEIDKSKTEFVSLASHQLRTPSTAVKWYSEMLLNPDAGKLNKKQLKYLQAIYHGNERMINLIDNLLKVSNIELGRIVVKNEVINIKKMLGNIIKEQELEIKKRKHKLVVENLSGINEFVADPFLFRMILQNFLSNAIKYTLDNGEITVAIKKSGSKILFSVADNGVGIPQAEQKRIFDKLFRASSSLELDKEGNGLGLYIVKQLSTTMGGRVWFESESGKGTTFYFELPIIQKL